MVRDRCVFTLYINFLKKICDLKNSGDCIISKRLRIETKRERATEKIQIERRENEA